MKANPKKHEHPKDCLCKGCVVQREILEYNLKKAEEESAKRLEKEAKNKTSAEPT